MPIAREGPSAKEKFVTCQREKNLYSLYIMTFLYQFSPEIQFFMESPSYIKRAKDIHKRLSNCISLTADSFSPLQQLILNIAFFSGQQQRQAVRDLQQYQNLVRESSRELLGWERMQELTQKSQMNQQQAYKYIKNKQTKQIKVNKRWEKCLLDFYKFLLPRETSYFLAFYKKNKKYSEAEKEPNEEEEFNEDSLLNDVTDQQNQQDQQEKNRKSIRLKRSEQLTQTNYLKRRKILQSGFMAAQIKQEMEACLDPHSHFLDKIKNKIIIKLFSYLVSRTLARVVQTRLESNSDLKKTIEESLRTLRQKSASYFDNRLVATAYQMFDKQFAEMRLLYKKSGALKKNLQYEGHTYLLWNASPKWRKLYIMRLKTQLQLSAGKSQSQYARFLRGRSSCIQTFKQFLCGVNKPQLEND